METHDRLMKVPTTDLTILEILTDNQERKSSVIRELLEVCNKKISKKCTDLRVLETIRRTLCYEYQTFINSGIRWSSFDTNKSKVDVETFFLRDIDCFTDTQEFALLYDIAMLQLAFSCNKEALIVSFKDFYKSQEEHLVTGHETLYLCLRVLECITDSYSLHSYLYKEHGQKEEFEELPKCIVNVIELWMKQEAHTKWQILVTLLPKLVSIYGVSKVVTPLWNKLLNEQNELDKTLDMLCVMADICFPTEEKLIQKIQYEYSVSTEFWLVLLRSLDSNIYQERKKAIYLIKRVLDFIESNESQIRIHLDISKAQMVPFIRLDALTKETTTNSIKKYFFLILESSEEKQKHLVLPALTYLPDLVKGYSTQKSQGYYFDRKWLQCVFKRILRHDNIAIKKLGFQEILKADLDIYDESLLNFLADFLNNTLLYDFDCIEKKYPEIVLQLVEFFIKSDKAQALLINSFVRAISKISWCPVAIRWIVEALVMPVERKEIVHNMWTPAELACCNNLMSCNFGSQCWVLQRSIVSNLWKAVCGYIPADFYWLDVELFTRTFNLLIDRTPEIGDPVQLNISKIIRAQDAQSYISDQCKTLWPGQSTKSFATTINVFVGSDLIFSNKDCQAERSLHELFLTLSDVPRRLYTDKTAILKVLELASYIMFPAGEIEYGCEMKVNRFLLQHYQAIVSIVESCIEKVLIPETEHTLASRTLIIYNSRRDIDNLRSFFDRCIDFVVNPNKLGKYHWIYALKVVNVYNECYSHEHTRFASKISPTKMQSLLKYFEEEILNVRREDDAKTNYEFDKKIVNDCCQNVVKFVCEYIQLANFNDLVDSGFWLQNLQLLVETGPEKTIIDVAVTISDPLITHYQQLKTEDLSSIISIIRLSCRLVFQMKKSKVFFDSVKQLTELIVDSNFLKLNEAKEIAIEWVDQLMEEGNRVPLLRHIFIAQLRNLDEQDTLLFMQPFMVCLLHGEVPRHDQKIVAAAIYADRYIDHEFNIDPMIRARAVIAMVKFLKGTKDLESEFREKVLQEILLILKKNRNKRYFDNSHVHRLKHRAMQALLVLEPYLNDKEVRYLYEETCDLLITESNQPSVRLMQEWLLVRIYANSLMDESIWKLFESAMEKRPGSIVSVSSIVYHISRLLKDEVQIEFISQAISHLLPSCMSQQFNVRLYSQVIFVKLYEILPEDCCDKYKIIFESVQESLRHGNLIKNSSKVMDDFYFTEFHPNEDYNLEMIYEHLPRLMGLPIDEWIERFMWENFIDNDVYPITQKCSSKWITIKSLKPPSRSAGGDSSEEIDSTNEGGLSDIQKKIIPWKSMTPFADELSEVSKAALERKITRNSDAGIIVVASLIDRAPNLGGLARTCEIFGAKELVIGSLKYVEDREFQTLSMSAEKWITITEVKEHLLRNYLIEQRSKGWKLVGAEQTANSTNLGEMKFDEKTILLLGNEKDGIPANLIPLLDTCVEIPQNGVVRSLNVHVTGAICIWQYAKQHFFT